MQRLAITLVFAAVLSPLAAMAQATGKEAMQTVARIRGADYLPRMLHVYGENGIPQPPMWRIIARDRQNAVREFFVSKGAIVGENVVPPANANGISATPLPMHRLNVDSSAAFTKAELAARNAKIGFDRVHYQLRCLELSTNAAWFLSLVNEKGALVGEVSVGASTGTVLTEKWYRVPLPPVAATPPPEEEPGFWQRARQGISRGANSIRKGVSNSAGWIQRKVSPDPAPPPPPPQR